MNSVCTTSTSPIHSSRNDLWKRYILLGSLVPWRKEKLYQELKAANVEQRFTKTVIREGYNLYGMHPALRDVLIDNGLMTRNEWAAGRFLMTLDEWQEHMATFTMQVPPVKLLTSFTAPRTTA